MDPKMVAKMKALKDLQSQDPSADGTVEPGVPVKTEPIVLPVEKPVRTPAIVLHPNAADKGGVTGEIDEGAAPESTEPSAEERNYPKGGGQDSSGLAELLSKLLGGAKDLGGAALEAPGKLGDLLGGKPKMTDVETPKAVTVEKQAVTVEPGKKKPFNKRAFFRPGGEEE